jgi:signal transduction histidine kinase
LVRILAISLFAGLVIVILSGYFFSGILLRPVRNISNEVNEISAQNLARRIATGPSKDEWYQLASTLNQLLNRLQESFETQRRFIANASHELSTPLTAISSQLDVCLQNPRETDEYRRVIQSVSQDVHNMSLLTQTLLEFAKASGDPGGLEISRIRMDEVLLRLPAEVSKLNSAYQVKLVFDDLPEEEEALLVLGNETLLLSALKNIVGNACKYSSDNRAEVGFAVQEKNLVLTITDHGIGVPEEELSRIFQPFYRVRENISEGGFGLGLPLAQRIIKLHDGVIQVTSKVGEGTRFVVQIPASNR